jgi:hypothetical protein
MQRGASGGHGPRSRCSRWSNRLEFSSPGTSDCHLVFAGSHRRPVGAAIASACTVHWMTGVVGKVIVPMIFLAIRWIRRWLLLMIISLWVLRKANPHRIDRRFRIIIRSLR